MCAGIQMSDIPSFPYRDLWEERTVRSVANLTRQDAVEFLALAARVPIRTEVEVHPLSKVNAALNRLSSGAVTGSVVIDPTGSPGTAPLNQGDGPVWTVPPGTGLPAISYILLATVVTRMESPVDGAPWGQLTT